MDRQGFTLIAVLGLGNILLSDEGVGVHAVNRLRAACAFPPHVRVLDGGTKDLELIGWLEGVERLLVIDAVMARQPPGTLIRLAGDQVSAHPGLVLSPHQMGLRDLLAALTLLDRLPAEVVLWGVEPASLATGVELSPAVAGQLDALIACVVEELRGWGVEPLPQWAQAAPPESTWRPRH